MPFSPSPSAKGVRGGRIGLTMVDDGAGNSQARARTATGTARAARRTIRTRRAPTRRPRAACQPTAETNARTAEPTCAYRIGRKRVAVPVTVSTRLVAIATIDAAPRTASQRRAEAPGLRSSSRRRAPLPRTRRSRTMRSPAATCATTCT